MPTYLFACDRQNTPLGGTGFSGRGYTAYGALTAPISPMTGFCGQPRDARMDRYPLGNGHRRYSPALMRFQEPDTLSPFDKGGINAYMYCAGDPVNQLDPTGGYSTLVSQIIQRSETIALHTASPLALLLGPEPKGALALNATRVALAGSATSVVAAGLGLAGVGAATYVANAGTALLAFGAGTRIAKAVWENRADLWQYVKNSVSTNARAVLGLRRESPVGASTPSATDSIPSVRVFTLDDKPVSPAEARDGIRVPA
ncbi:MULTISPECIES: RHS repeat-associated core domain-containing protein [unclassified Pseudomonas]|uniref:RHS repeat-associated core domain-containing protein n=1 Tax=unclassified Pseudomonas TaxID=196821 RepID=UPI002113F3A8|nr:MULTISPECIES: RHS repeat-associated core domain-containing protein [unclassified Pseudomonas]UVL19061.1 RHS repeat-associated core domain-containing protein [Pseudomonas sp. B21-044]